MSDGSCPTVINRTIIHNGLRNQGIEGERTFWAMKWAAGPIAISPEASASRMYCCTAA
jgi:hypothetical protein